ncbi:MAG: C25 family cysteine peptidase [Ferruginibacter sp.]
MMKKIFIPMLLVLLSTAAHAQLNNSWIDYNKTYYKFKLGKDTLCRIPQPVLAAAGLGAVNADHFQLWRNGEQVRLYTSVSNAPLGTSDFIEFFGQANDGRPDKQLYRDADFQLSDKYSLETDTAAYFLTVNPAGGNLRYNDVVNSAPSAATPDAYFMRTMDYNYRVQINRGEARPVGEYVYSSSYDPGEGWTSATAAPCCDLVKEFFNLNVYTAGPANSLSVRVNAAGNAPNTRNLKIKLFNNEITTAPYSNPINLDFFSYKKASIDNLPISLLQNPNYLPIYVNGTSTVTLDRMVVAKIEFTYPATFNFVNERYFPFDLAASATGNYLVIDNFNYGSVAPVLYDMTSGSRYIGEIASTPGKVKFVLPPSSQARKLILMNQENAQSINSFTQRNFVNITDPSNQGDYVIISHPVLYNDGSGNNYVDQYRQYRSTVAGGGYNAKVYDINDLTDQFGFGIKHHPGAIRDFIRYADTNFVQKPKYLLIIGRGVNYIDQRTNETNPLIEKLNLITPFGWPASDGLLAATPGISTPLVPVGRLGVVNGGEINNYLQKVQQYESTQQTTGSTLADKGWMKNMIHVAGGKDSSENNTFKGYMNSYKAIAEDTLYGGEVETFTKTSTGAIQQASSQRIEQLFNEGLGFIGYFGHSSANTFEFNLSNPEIYQNAGKYPFFNVSGCSAGNFFIFDPLRLTGNLSLSEKYVLANQRGSIGFLADTHFGIPPYLNFYNTTLYESFCRTMYGNTIGNQAKHVVEQLGGNNPALDFYTRIHLEEVTLHGDPAIKINTFAKPDYVIEDQLVKISPNIISVADVNFNVKIKMMNIGKAIGDSMWISVKRKLPNDSIRVLYNQLVPSIRNIDSLDLTVPIIPTTDKGLNQIIISLDHTNRIDEQFETNNILTKEFYVFEDELRPAFPYNFSIINQQNITYVANTANPISGQRQYVMEIDTTELFNSPFKKVYNKNGNGGIVEFTPSNVTFTDSTVYYWRVAMVPTNNAPYIWNGFSFIYLPGSSSGFNQSHYYQHKKSNYSNITLDADRNFRFQEVPKGLTIRTGLYPFYGYDKINVNLDFDQLELYGCVYNALQFYVFDTTTLQPWYNRNVSPTNGLYGSYRVCQNTAIQDTTRRFFEFPYNNPTYRQKAMEFLDLVPDGMYVAITNLGNKNSNSSFISQWQNDTLTLGSGNSLYHKLKSVGFTQIDSFYKNLPFLYFFKKGSTSFTPTQIMGPQDSTYIDETFTLTTTSSDGTIESPLYGPARAWTDLHWRGFSNDPAPAADSVKIQVWGVKNDGSSTLLSTVAPAQDTSLSFVDANVYPYMKLVMRNKDQRYITPHQLRYLRVNASFAPEGAVAPDILFRMKDTVDQGEAIDFALAFKNISQTPFDSLIKVKFVITDRNNVPHDIIIPKRKALVAGDTLTLSYSLDTRNYPGNNTLFVEFNPDNDQPEQYHYNNVLFKDFTVREDRFNPLLDVTFDGVHILNKDIVASKPHIFIRLKDESRYLEIRDTSSISLQVRYPDQSLHTYSFGDTMRFTPANLANGENTATIDFMPYFPEDGEYELIVTGKDAAGNKAGDLEYRIVFSVINKPMISNLLNYPNPFTTSTAFVFTVTGSEVPQNMRIQILTITGKVVREITKDELGPIHIGRNITEYKWDGTDMYGQKLANGVYIYRVLTNLNGKSLDKYKAAGDNTDKYFNKGYGKMYLMR